MSTREAFSVPVKGFCYLCGTEVEGDAIAHLQDVHPSQSRQTRVGKMSWQDRMDKLMLALTEIRDEPDPGVQIERLDVEVIQELYLVRQKIAQTKGTPVMRAKEGS